jgi:hypothetical protein
MNGEYCHETRVDLGPDSDSNGDRTQHQRLSHRSSICGGSKVNFLHNSKFSHQSPVAKAMNCNCKKSCDALRMQTSPVTYSPTATLQLLRQPE